jgi:hypothetical protein
MNFIIGIIGLMETNVDVGNYLINVRRLPALSK